MLSVCSHILLIYCIIDLQSYVIKLILPSLCSVITEETVSSCLSHTASRQHYKKMFYSQSVSFYWLQKSFWQSKAGPDAESKKKKNMDREIVMRRGEREWRGYVFSQSPLSSLFLGWSVSLTPSVISSASLLGGQALSVQYLFLFSQLSGERTRMMVPLL